MLLALSLFVATSLLRDSRVNASPFIPSWQLEPRNATIFTKPFENFTWTSIDPSPDLRYVDCGGGFQCARLELPLDWNASIGSPTYREKFNMAIVRLPAQVPVTDPRYGGPILINPGGPGGSGTESALYSSELQMRYDAAFSNGSSTYVSSDPTALYFDIIGFDPRGVSASTPWHTCFKNVTDMEMAYNKYGRLRLEWPLKNLDAIWQGSIESSRNCIWDPVMNPTGSKIAKFASTAMVARDLVEFVERHGEWRALQSNDSDPDTKERLAWQPGEEPILFVGFSYGTLLGATLAAMQPHRVKRFILDGVVSAEEYFAGNGTMNAMSTDDLINDFFDYCARAGPGTCALWAGNAANDTKKNFEATLDLVDQHSSSVQTQGPTEQWTSSDIKARMHMLDNDPLTNWSEFAKFIVDLKTNQSASLPGFWQARRTIRRGSDLGFRLNEFDPYDPSTAFGPDHVREWFTMIVGDDTATRRTKTEFMRSWKEFRDVSQWGGDGLAYMWQGVSTWPVTSTWRFGDSHPIASNATRNPILFMSMLYDGTTSLAAARQVSSRFRGAKLLIVDGHGHTSHAEPSLCAARAERRYFQTGELPYAESHCLPSWTAFNEGLDENLRTLNMEDKSLLQVRYRGAWPISYVLLGN